MTDCEDLYNARVKTAVEPDFSSWSLVWDAVYTSNNGSENNVLDLEFKIASEDNNVMVYIDEYAYVWTLNLTTGDTIAQTRYFTGNTVAGTLSSVFGKYIAYIDNDTGHIIVLKNGVGIADITPTHTLRTVAISPDGKYIFAEAHVFSGSYTHYRVLYKGS